MDEGKMESTPIEIDSTSDSDVFNLVAENVTVAADAFTPDSVDAASIRANAPVDESNAQDQERHPGVIYGSETNQSLRQSDIATKVPASPPEFQEAAKSSTEEQNREKVVEQPHHLQHIINVPLNETGQSQIEVNSSSAQRQSPQMAEHHHGENAEGQMDTSLSQNVIDTLETSSQPSATAAVSPSTVGGIVTQVAPAIMPDIDTTDEAYAESTSTSYVTSIKSEVSRGVLENERLYPSYGQHQYGMPVDDDELDRMDLQHRKYELVIGDKHFLAPIGPTPQRILDLGTGTGIWALDMADMYPSAQVIGVDIAPIQPKWVASNCQFEIDDVEEAWTYKQNSFDFIHFRDPLYSIRDWPKLMRQCYEHLKPGGWCELACIYPVPKCDDGSMPPDSGFKVICDKFMEASVLFGTPVDCPLFFTQYFHNAGFQNVAEHIFKIPSSPWPKDKRLKQIGALEMTNVVEGSTAFGLRAFEQVFGWSKEQTELVMVNFRRDVSNRHFHQYCEYFVVYGQKAPDYGINSGL